MDVSKAGLQVGDSRDFDEGEVEAFGEAPIGLPECLEVETSEYRARERKRREAKKNRYRANVPLLTTMKKGRELRERTQNRQ